MQSLTKVVDRGWRAWVPSLVLLVLLASGPENLSRIVSGLSSAVTSPFTQSIGFASDDYEVFNTEIMLVYLIVVIGMNVLSTSGLLSIGHNAIFAVGAYSEAILTTRDHVNFAVALLVSAALSAVLGYVLSLPARRLGLFAFAMITLGYGLVVGDLASDWRGLTGGPDGFTGVIYPFGISSLSTYYWVIAVFVAVSYWLSRNLIRSRIGRSLKAVSEAPEAAQSLGIDVARRRTQAFIVSAVLAGVAGGLYVPLVGFLAPDSFSLSLATLFILMAVLGGSGTVAGPIVGTVLLFRLPIDLEKVAHRAGDWTNLGYGVALLVIVILAPRGLMTGWWWARARFGWGPKTATADSESPVREVGQILPPRPAPDGGLEVDGVSVTFGGLAALTDVTLFVKAGTVHALIGPNGAGKTTFLNVASGYQRRHEGRVSLFGEGLESAKPFARARRGLARTFQTPLVFEAMSCRENVMVALDSHSSVGFGRTLLSSPRSRSVEREAFADARDCLALVGLAELADSPASRLTPGQRRLLELARVVALAPSVILMDEPAAGLSNHEIHELAELVHELKTGGLAILLVEHHVDLVMKISDEITVLDRGTPLAHGTPEQIGVNPEVAEVYLGHGTAGADPADLGELGVAADD